MVETQLYAYVKVSLSGYRETTTQLNMVHPHGGCWLMLWLNWSGGNDLALALEIARKHEGILHALVIENKFDFFFFFI